jgi:hypothetical protein
MSTGGLEVEVIFFKNFFFIGNRTVLLEDHSVCIMHEHKSVNNYTEVDIDVRPKSLMKLTREIEEVKPQARDH